MNKAEQDKANLANPQIKRVHKNYMHLLNNNCFK
jgi:hypothetical protein